VATGALCWGCMALLRCCLSHWDAFMGGNTELTVLRRYMKRVQAPLVPSLSHTSSGVSHLPKCVVRAFGHLRWFATCTTIIIRFQYATEAGATKCGRYTQVFQWSGLHQCQLNTQINKHMRVLCFYDGVDICNGFAETQTRMHPVKPSTNPT
jgi:hypothetical protein